MPNKTLEPTADGVVSSAIAVNAASRRWLSFCSLGIKIGLRFYRAGWFGDDLSSLIQMSKLSAVSTIQLALVYAASKCGACDWGAF